MVLGLCAGACCALTPCTDAQAQNVTDQAVTDIVEDELVFDSAVATNAIDVETSEWIVTLAGSASNIFMKDRAERIAETVKGVRGVVNEIEVQPGVARLDSEIREDIDAALLEDPATDSYEVSVAVDEGVVTLSGTVESW